MSNTNKTTYSVIVRSSSTWIERADGTREYEITDCCGHRHQSVATAQACLDKLTAWYCNCGELANAHHRHCNSNGGNRHTADSTSARWYHAQVEASDGSEII